MDLIIQGGQKLEGKIAVNGSKNAAGPLIAASVLVKGKIRFANVPRLTDVLKLLEILVGMGAKVEWTDEHALTIDTKDMDPSKLDRKRMKSMRYSILLLGPMLARFRKVVVPEPGGCNIGNRPIETHLFALSSLGAKSERDVDGTLYLEAEKLKGSYVILPEFSVTATETLIMAAAVATGTTSIRLAAAEPHVQELCEFLNLCGAKISGLGTHDLEIQGVKTLHAPKTVWSVMPDMIEMGTFAAAAAVTRGTLDIGPVIPSHLDATRSLLRRIGVQEEIKKNRWHVKGVAHMKAFKLQAMIFPGFPTDLQALFGLIATQCHGTSLIQEPLYESRLGYLNELAKMGANVVIADPHRAVVSGPTPLYGTEIRSLDLRAGATMILAGLIAEGETIIHDAEIIARGYENLDERLRGIGAEIGVGTDRV
jgi:UDP-N-acetylglucosamine 1-carboxyvinyltransferase